MALPVILVLVHVVLLGFVILHKYMNQPPRQGLQILLMSGVTVTSASQILESFWNIWRQVSQQKKLFFRISSTWPSHVYTIVRDTRSSCGGLLTWKAQIHDGGHRVNFDCNLPSSCFVMQYNSLILMS